MGKETVPRVRSTSRKTFKKNIPTYNSKPKILEKNIQETAIQTLHKSKNQIPSVALPIPQKTTSISHLVKEQKKKDLQAWYQRKLLAFEKRCISGVLEEESDEDDISDQGSIEQEDFMEEVSRDDDYEQEIPE